MSSPPPHEVVVGRRGRWVWDGIRNENADAPMSEAWGPRAHPERCDEGFGEPPANTQAISHVQIGQAMVQDQTRFERRVVLRLTLTMIGVWGLWAVAGVSAYLLLRWLRVACWLTGCPA